MSSDETPLEYPDTTDSLTKRVEAKLEEIKSLCDQLPEGTVFAACFSHVTGGHTLFNTFSNLGDPPSILKYLQLWALGLAQQHQATSPPTEH